MGNLGNLLVQRNPFVLQWLDRAESQAIFLSALAFSPGRAGDCKIKIKYGRRCGAGYRKRLGVKMSVSNHSTPFPFFVPLCPIHASPRHVSWLQSSNLMMDRSVSELSIWDDAQATRRNPGWSSFIKLRDGVMTIVQRLFISIGRLLGLNAWNISWRHNSFRPSGLLFSWERNHQNLLDSFYTIRATSRAWPMRGLNGDSLANQKQRTGFHLTSAILPALLYCVTARVQRKSF